MRLSLISRTAAYMEVTSNLLLTLSHFFVSLYYIVSSDVPKFRQPFIHLELRYRHSNEWGY